MDKKQLELENEIYSFIYNDNKCFTHFEWREWGEDIIEYELQVYTFNPKHDQYFLLYTSNIQNNKVKILEEVLNFLKEPITQECNSYTVVWCDKDKEAKHTSYFYALDVLDVIDKVYYNKKRESIIVYEIKLNPES